MKVRKVPQVVIKELATRGFSVAYTDEYYSYRNYMGYYDSWKLGKAYRVYSPGVEKSFIVYVSQLHSPTALRICK